MFLGVPFKGGKTNQPGGYPNEDSEAVWTSASTYEWWAFMFSERCLFLNSRTVEQYLKNDARKHIFVARYQGSSNALSHQTCPK